VTTLLDAVRAGDVRTVQTVLGQRPGAIDERDADGTSLLLVAAIHGHPRVVDALLAAGADVDVFAAAALGRVGELDILLGLDPTLVSATSPSGETALQIAARFGQAEAARVLLDHGADPATAPPSGEPT
jgi:ankyrin repeat protein